MSLVLLCLCVFSIQSSPSLVIDPCKFASASEARSKWVAGDGALPADVSGHGIQLKCNLTGEHQRAYWDQEVSVDLSRYDRIKFSFFVEDANKVSSTFNMYFQSGTGWYTTGFTAEQGWNQIDIPRSQFGTEGKPEGWKHISRLRLGAWKSIEGVSNIGVADIEAISSEIVVIQGDRTPVTSLEYGTVLAQSDLTTKLLTDAGMSVGGMADSDVEDGALIGRKVAIFPHNPDMTELEMDQVEKFVRSGGKVLGFYGVHPRLLKLIGVELTSWQTQKFPGQFASIHFTKSYVPELPNSVQQASWNSNIVRPIRPSAEVVGQWFDSKGHPLGIPAVVASENGAYMSHVLLGDDPDGKMQMMLALVGHFDTNVWQQACSRAARDLQVVGEFKSMKSAVLNLGSALTSQVVAQEAKARTAESQRQYSKALSLYQSAKSSLVRAYCMAQVSKPKEMRAVWCHSAFGVAGKSWAEVSQELAGNGFTSIFPNMLWGGRAYYPSKFLPMDESVAKEGDQIKKCVEAAHHVGLQVHVWKVNWNLINAPVEFLAQMRAANRTQKDPNGKDLDWLCPSNTLNFELERNSMLEVVTNYPIDGIHFDYIRYPGSEGCYCEGCRKRFEDENSIRIVRWPQDVLTGPLKVKFLQFRRSNISLLVRAVSAEARKIRPLIKVSAAVFADWPLCRDSVGQDWASWVKSGYMDFVCPMDYTVSATQYEQWMKIQNEAVGESKYLRPGVGATLTNKMTADQIALQIKLGRNHGSSGFILFNLDSTMLNSVLPNLHLGITK